MSGPGERIWAGGMWFYVIGILKPAVLAPEIDSSVLIGYPAAEKYLNFDGRPSTIYVRAATRRVSEIGLRRAVGATKGHIRIQFLCEAIFLAAIGGISGVAAGTAATAIYARHKGWAAVIPPEAWAGGIGAALVIGALAGLLPAIRAARMSPTQALWTM